MSKLMSAVTGLSGKNTMAGFEGFVSELHDTDRRGGLRDLIRELAPSRGITARAMTAAILLLEVTRLRRSRKSEVWGWVQSDLVSYVDACRPDWTWSRQEWRAHIRLLALEAMEVSR